MQPIKKTKIISNMITPQHIANYFLKKTHPEFGDVMSNLKLQKMVYYAQGFHLAMFDEPFFEGNISAWEHGPVVVSLYHEYSIYGAGEIPAPESVDLEEFTDGQIELLDEVFEVYGQFAAWKLRNMTHSERPWLETNKNDIISKDLMKEFFKTLLN